MKNYVHPVLRLRPLALFFIVIALLLSALGCKDDKDPCENITCLNGGVCLDGSCLCANGYTGINCSVAPDPCAGITCLNGGTCANGNCNCPEMWTGSDCSQQVTPSRIKVLKVTISDFPPTTAAGGGWDLDGTGPDIYFKLSYNGTDFYQSDYVLNADYTESYIFTMPSTPSVFLYSPTDKYIISLYEYDSLTTDQFMGSIEFTPYSSTNGFPPIRVVSCSTCKFVANMQFDYQF